MTELHIEYLPGNKRFAVPDNKFVEQARHIVEFGKKGAYDTHLDAAGIANMSVFHQIRVLCVRGEFDPEQIFLHMPGGDVIRLNAYCAISDYKDIPAPDVDASEEILMFAWRKYAQEKRPGVAEW